MREDEILLVVVIVMLIASTYMGYCVQRNLHHSRKAFEAFTLAARALNERVVYLERRVSELEMRSARTQSQPRLSS